MLPTLPFQLRRASVSGIPPAPPAPPPAPTPLPASSFTVNPQNVLIVRNSNAAQSSLSQSVADWYATNRGMRDGSSRYFFLDFDFGNGSSNLLTKLAADYLGTANPFYGGSSWTTGNGQPNIVLDHASTPVLCTAQSANIGITVTGTPFLQALATVIDNFSIQAILVTPGVPARVMGPYGGGAGVYFGQPTETFCAMAFQAFQSAFSSRQRFLLERGGSRSVGVLSTSGSTSGTARTMPTDNGLANKLPRWGRIGWALPGNPDTFSSLADVQAMVNNAKTAETTTNTGKVHVMGGSAYIYGGGVVNSTALNFIPRDLGFTNYGAIQGAPPGIGTAELTAWANKPAWAGSALLAENFNGTTGQWLQAPGGGKITAFAVSSPILNTGRGNIDDTQYTSRLGFMPGGWAYAWLSDALNMAVFALKQGASLAYTCVDEPFNFYLGDIDAVGLLTMRGLMACDVAYRAGANTIGGTGANAGNSTVLSAWGDPLYTPYLITRG